MDEKTYILTSFKNNFWSMNSKPIAIYGLGKNTNEIIKAYPDFNIVGLLDSNCIGQIIYGKKVLSFDEVLKYRIEIVIIVARNSNLQIIYRRIEAFCREHNIQVYDINGNCLKKQTFELKKLPDVYGCMKKEILYGLIDNADVISFDIFDTLLMRIYLEPTDVFYEIEKNTECDFEAFAEKRILAERSLYDLGNPTIYDIYDTLCRDYGMTSEEKKYYMQKEIEAEKKCILPRKEMIDTAKYALNINKKVYLTSDMYLTSEIIADLLKINGLPVSCKNILVSCEYGKSKCNGLFRELIKENKEKKILHIGDNYEADIVSAKDAGIESFEIRSALKMLDDSKLHNLLKYTANKYERDLIGGFIAKQFNNPFLFSYTDGRCKIISEYQLGYYFIAPIVAYFIKWMINKIRKNAIEKMLLSARDGYLLVKVLDKLKINNADLPDYIYFYASRQVCVLAGIKTENDILYALSLAFSGTMEQLLEKRFMLNKCEIMPRKEGMSDEEYIILHKEIILEKANILRKRYLKYIHNIGIKDKDKIAYFDFVSSGSCQKGLENILNRNIAGIYFVRVEDEHKKNLSIDAFYKSICVYDNQQAIMDNYFFLENVFSSFEPSLSSFDNEGKPIFLAESRTANQKESLKEIQKGILDAACNIYDKLPDKIVDGETELPDMFLRFINRRYAMITTDYFEKNSLKDEFCNREFNISMDII